MVETIQTDCLIIGGDFNVPEVSWKRYMCQTGVVSGVGREMINMVRTFALTRILKEPTRGNNILYLVLTDQPAWVKSSLILPGISDHHVVLCDMHVSYEKTQPNTARRMHNYASGNTAEMCSSLEEYFQEFEFLSDSLSVNDLWLLFKANVLRDPFGPSW
ncbi:unnamed protein product [Ixodes pacificus]